MEEVLKQILEKLSSLEEGQKEFKADISRLEKKLDTIYTQTATLTENDVQIQKDIQQIKKDVSTIEKVTASNYSDIANLKAAK